MSGSLPPPPPAKYILREMNQPAREFYRRLAETGRAATTRCESCNRSSFPPLARCPACGSAQTWIELPDRGALYAFTTQETALRFGAPAVLALAEVGEVTLPGVVHSAYADLRIGQPVSLRAFAEPETELTLVEFAPD